MPKLQAVLDQTWRPPKTNGGVTKCKIGINEKIYRKNTTDDLNFILNLLY